MDNETMEKMSCMTLRHLSSKGFIIPTKGIKELESRITTLQKIGTTGACIWGRARIGKTRAITYVSNSLCRKYNFPVFIWTITDHPETEKSFYASLLQAMGISVEGFNKTALILKERVLNLLAVQACESPLRKVILFIDEASKLNEKDFSWLMDLYNNLSLNDIQLVCFLCGTRELKDLKTDLKIQGKDQIVGRFMVNEIAYYGLKTKKELELCLYSLDKIMMVDESGNMSDQTLLDFYFPYASEKAFFSIGDEYWDAFNNVKSAHGVKADDVPMKYLIDSFAIMLDTYGALSECAVEFPTIDEITSSIELSGYGESDDKYEHKKRKK